MLFRIYKEQENWDAFWESQNEQRPLKPKNWAGSPESKFLSYLFAISMLVGGFLAMLSSFFDLVKFLN